jgi:hypothetical protein
MSTPADLRLVKGLEKPEELAKLFPGATPEAVADLDLGSNSYLTVFGAEQSQAAGQPVQAKVNVNTAMPEVLRALIVGSPGGPSGGGVDATVQAIVEKRQETQLKTSDLAAFKVPTSVADVKSTYFRVESVGVVGSVRKRVVAVLKPNRGQQQVNPQPGNQQQGNQLATNTSTMLYFKVE